MIQSAGQSAGRLAYESRVMAKSPNTGRVEKNLGLGLKNAGGVSTSEVAASYANAKEAQRQLTRTKAYAANQKKIMDLLVKIEAECLSLAQHGFRTDIAIENLIATGEKSSAQYQSAVLLIEHRKKLALLEIANKSRLDHTLASSKSQKAIAFQNYKHGLSEAAITQAYAQKQQLASQQSRNSIAASRQNQIEAAQFRAALKGETANSGGNLLSGGNTAVSSGGFWQKVNQAFRF
jgi:hypothetical protein